MPTQAIFRLALGEDAWQRLAAPVRQHYDLAADSANSKTLNGVMDEIFHAPAIKPLLWLARGFGGLVPWQGRDVPVEVRNWTDPARPNCLFWHRRFQFADGRRLVFASRMELAQDGEIIEFLRFGIGVRMRVAESGGALVYTARDHCWKIGPWLLGIPHWLLLGEARIVESPAAEGGIRLDFTITHPWLGRSFGYRGRFAMVG